MELNVDLLYLPVVNFAMQQNHVPVLREIKLRNTSNTTIEDITITLTFEPDFASGYKTHIESISPGCEETVSPVPIVFSTRFLADLTERVSGSIHLRVSSGDRELFNSTYAISVLSYNDWCGTQVLPEILAAYSVPNHPEISSLTRRAAEILGEWTGSPSLDEYQQRDPNRVKLQMAAVYEAIAEKSIIYSAPLASFEKTGQKIRLVDEVIGKGLGTCLDMAMMYVSCLESIGLNPIVVLTQDHAIAGCWLIKESFSDSVNEDPSMLTKRTAAGINEILLVETTCMNAGCKASFDEACRSADNTLHTAGDVIFIDIHRSRISQIRPLPLRVRDDGSEDINEVPADRRSGAPESLTITDIGDEAKAEIGKRTVWERNLLDLTLRNNLLNTRITRSTLPIISTNINKLEDSLADNQDFRILPMPQDWNGGLLNGELYKTINAEDPVFKVVEEELSQNRIHTYLDDISLKNGLTHLYRTSRTALEENGASTLYLALGLLKWYETPTSVKEIYAPILLMPVELVRKSAATGYVLRRRDEETMLNITLLEFLRQEFDITINGLDPLPADAIGVDVPLVLNIIRKGIMEQPRWDVVEQAIIGNFSFSKFIMWNDIHYNSDELCRGKVVSSLVSGMIDESLSEDIPEEANLDEKFKVGDIELPISADSSQLEAINAALEGKSFILHGPPGTGKSQTITNIIANAIYRGKKVLFVAEKMAALEVVQNRLEAIGIGPFCLELHSNKTKKSSVIEQLNRVTEVSRETSGKEYVTEARSINAVRMEMNAYITALHKTRAIGWSLYDCFSGYYAIDEGCPAIDFQIPKMFRLTMEEITYAQTLLPEFITVCGIVGNPAEHPLLGIALTEYPADIDKAFRDLGELDSACGKLSPLAQKLTMDLFNATSGPLSLEKLKALSEICAAILSSMNMYAEILSLRNESDISIVEDACLHGEKRDAAQGRILQEYDESILSLDTAGFDREWRSAEAKSFIPRFFSRNRLLRVLRTYSKNRAKPSKESVLPLMKAIADYQAEQAVLGERAAANKVFAEIFKKGNCDWNAIAGNCGRARVLYSAADRLADNEASVISTRETLAGMFAFDAAGFIRRNEKTFREFIETFEALKTSLGAVREEFASNLVDDSASGWLAAARDVCARWTSGRGKLRNWILYNLAKSNLDNAGFPEIASQVESGAVPVEVVPDAFKKGLYKTYAEYVISHKRDLRIFHGLMFEEKIQRFRSLCKEFESLTRKEIFAKLASNLPDIQQEAAKNSEIGILQRNLKNRCRGISLRRFFDLIPNLLPRLCPCMLMSPISVAQYLDIKRDKFDLVIFDEASQMPTCEAVGAIARGKNIIVVGDPKQMPPTNFFSMNTFDEDNSEVEDLESILDDCLALSLPSKYLRWHYRSKHESLIAFSNCKFYDNKLFTFPSTDDLTTRISYQHVEGIYDRGGNRQNRAEAEAVIAEIKARLKDPELSKRSIGVVTFNNRQQSLIEDLLTDLFAANPSLEKTAMSCEEPIFVKNLENVQGDERDVILFSVGYGQDKYGKVLLNFGPLNREGGERRLNVAVSRARYEMKVFSTLLSDQIDLRRSSANGVACLKSFLEYAEKGRSALLYSTAASSKPTDGFIEEVASELRKAGFDVRTNVGCSGYRVDIGIVNPGNGSDYILGILCDGYGYSASKSARDREIIQTGILEALGWKITRVWSTEWWNDKDEALRRLTTEIQTTISKAS